ncbi:WD domain-containing protein 37 [Elsinoe fawcettii]|nr:WD domain-containing protein 37 [Elsinoe fawcettii]
MPMDLSGERMVILEDLPSSQPSMADSEMPFPDLPSSSQVRAMANSRPKRPPTITPKRFTRFFTPRQSVSDTRKTKHATRASRKLRDITKNAVNQKPTSAMHQSTKIEDDEIENLTPRRSKRRKLTPIPESSPIQLQSSPSRHVGDFKPIDLFDDAASIDDLDQLCDDFSRLPTPIKRLQPTNSSKMLQRSFGGPSVLQRGRTRDPCVIWRHATADFYSGAEDVSAFDSQSLPFCVTACRSNSLVALGGEGGTVTLLDSSSDPDISFAKPHISFKPHSNAIMDMSFSSDDYLIATASGDQTARVIDMRTQQTRYIMAGHVSSVKTVRFQPGNDSVLATSSRDGSVQLWDLRCRGTTVPPCELRVSATRSLPTDSSGRQIVYAETCISIRDAHSSAGPPPLPRKSSADLFSTRSTPAPASRNDVSITALSFLPCDKSHILLSASEANASIKVWDIRGKYNRRGPAVPLASTAEPPSHIKSRKYGINSLALSGDGGRLYALCRDSTVYAYSTNHLAIGHVSELDSEAATLGRGKWRGYGAEKEGLGPLYGFKHRDLKVSSFYVKAGVRKAGNGKEEMLAVGSRDGSAILFPTNEGYFKREVERHEARDPASLPGTPVKLSSRKDELPIYETGTSLVRGHRKEVTSLSWTADGELVTISDDFTARCWREGPKARELRQGGEGQGQRWGCGWAEIEDEFDDEEV